FFAGSFVEREPTTSRRITCLARQPREVVLQRIGPVPADARRPILIGFTTLLEIPVGHAGVAVDQLDSPQLCARFGLSGVAIPGQCVTSALEIIADPEPPEPPDLELDTRPPISLLTSKRTVRSAVRVREAAAAGGTVCDLTRGQRSIGHRLGT